MKGIHKSSKLKNVCYDIRGPVLREVEKMEQEGNQILKLNIGNPAPFGFKAPDEILYDVILNLPHAQGYCDSKGLFAARKAIMAECQNINIKGVGIDDIFIGNGVSELIVMATSALLNNDDEVLVPAPDYPLWTAAIHLAGGRSVHYICNEEENWQPDLNDIESKITSKTKAIVIINPNNPTGAVYTTQLLMRIVEIAREHELIIFSDEIYDKILYDGVLHTPIASLASDVPFVTFNGLSKSYRVAGFRSGWMIISGAKECMIDYVEGLNILASMRLCANVPAQYAIQTALGGYQSIKDLVSPTGRFYTQRTLACDLINKIPGVSCVKPQGALYLFVRLDQAYYPITDDEAFVLDLLREEKLLLVHGRAFSWPKPDHLRIVFLPDRATLEEAIRRLERFLRRHFL